MDLRPFNDWWLRGGWLLTIALMLLGALLVAAVLGVRERRRDRATRDLAEWLSAFRCSPDDAQHCAEAFDVPVEALRGEDAESIHVQRGAP